MGSKPTFFSHLSLGLGAALLLTTAPLAAQETGEEITLADIIVSGGLSGIEASAYGRAYSVVTGAEIAERGLSKVQDALRLLPGLSISSTGANYTQLRMRGGEANHTLILIDGVEAAGGADEYIFSGLSAGDIERIEVLRGPQSAAYGANASTGVVNIITRKGEPGLHYGGRVELGDAQGASAYVSQRGERGGLRLDLSYSDDAGYDYAGDGGEKDAIRRRGLSLSGDVKLGEDATLGFSLRHAKERAGFDRTNFAATGPDNYLLDDPSLFSNREEMTGALWGTLQMLEGRMEHRLDYQGSTLRMGTEPFAATKGTTEKLKYRLSYALSGESVESATHLLNLLAEARQDRSDLAPNYDRSMKALALEYRAAFDSGLDLQAGLRRDFNDTFADFTSWNIGLSWPVPGTGLRLHSAAGRGQVNPSYYELFANDGFTLGNPNLAPEQNQSFDIGLEAQVLNGRGTLDVTYFRERLRDEITFVPGAAPGGRGTYRNEAGTSPREGIELSGRLAASETLSLGVNYTYLDAQNADGSVEIRRPRHELGLSASQQFSGGKALVTADLHAVADAYDTQFWGGFATEKLPDYWTLNLSGRYAISDTLQATARIENLLDKDYQTVWGYTARGRAIYAGLEAQW